MHCRSLLERKGGESSGEMGPRDLRKEMVDDVEFDDVVEHVLADEAKLSVNSSRSTFKEGPRFGLEFGKVGMCMVKISDGDDPVIDPHIGLEIKESNHMEADLGGCVMKYCGHEADTQVRENDEVAFFRAKDRTIG